MHGRADTYAAIILALRANIEAMQTGRFIATDAAVAAGV
jgi:hypothetical protein